MEHFEVTNKRILEVGCGLGLSSLVLNSRGADITATDIHPEVHPNLKLNTQLNGGTTIPYFDADWGSTKSGGKLFDLVIASDVLYQPDHPPLLARFMSRHTREAAQIIVVDPARGRLSKFGKELKECGFTRFNKRIGEEVMQANRFKGQVHTFEKNN